MKALRLYEFKNNMSQDQGIKQSVVGILSKGMVV